MPAGQQPKLPQYRKDLVTRRLCAVAHLDRQFAREVLEEYAEDGIHAVGLPMGVNLVALVRHAHVADARRRQADRLLTQLFAGGVTLALAGVLLLGSGAGEAAQLILFLALGAFPAAGVLVHRTEWEARCMARRVETGNTVPADLVPPCDAALEQQLHSLRRANLVAYHASSASQNPFVGSGWRITESVWEPIDISRPAAGPSGGTKTPLPFDATDLHHHLATSMAAATGLDALTARNRLYVCGPDVPALGSAALPDPTRRPLAVIPSALVRAGAAPQPSGAAQTYLCLRTSGRAGRAVVSMHLRAELHHPLLTWEVAAYVLPPLGPRFFLPHYLAGPESEARRATAWYAVRGMRRALTGAPGRLWQRRRRAAERARLLEQRRREIRDGTRAHDYGTVNSLRERVSDWSEMGYAERRDTSLYFKAMVQGVLSTTADFLADHHIDTSDLRNRQQQIINSQTYNFNGVVNGQVQAGNQGQMNVQQQPMAPPGGGQGAAAAGAPPAPGAPASP